MDTILIGSALENTLPKGPKDCSTPKERQERNIGEVLKESTNGNSSLSAVKKDKNKHKVKALFESKSSSASSCNSLKVYQDSCTPQDGHNVRCSRSVQTEDSLLDTYLHKKQVKNANESTDSGNLSECLDQEAYDLMVNETIPENYWKDVAEQRRLALNDTLEENEKLSFEIEHLKDENRRLSGIASKVEVLENLLHDALADDEDDEDQSECQKSVPPESSSNIDSKDTKSIEGNEEGEESAGDTEQK